MKRLPFKVFADSSPDWELWVAPDGKILYCSPGCEKLTGYTRREIVSNPEILSSIVHEDDLERWRSHVGQENEASGPLELDFSIMARGGGRVRLHHVCCPIVDGAGTRIGVRACNRPFARTGADGAVMPREDAALRSLSTRYWAMLSAVPDIIMEVNKDKVYTWANHAGFAFFGTDVIGHEAEFYFEGAQETYETVQPLFNGNEDVIYLESWQRRQDGEKRLLAWWCRSLKDEEGNTVGALSSARDITEQSRAKEELRQSEARYRRLLHSVTGYIYSVKVENGRAVSTVHGPGCQAVTGYAPGDYEADAYLWYRMIHEQDRGCVEEAVSRLLEGGKPSPFEHRILHRDGSQRWIRHALVTRDGPSGELLGYDGLIEDITDRKRAEEERERLEARLRQSQRLEAVGMLAGGIAHDFNNMLAVILGYAEALQDEMPPDAGMRAELGEIVRAATRSSELTRQLLAFARRQTLEMKSADLNGIILDIRSMLRRSLRENIAIDLRLSPSPCVITADKGQIGQVILNLALNAQYAMPDGGRLAIETSEVFLDHAYSQTHEEVSAGLHVMLAVSDTGVGMDSGTMERIFEPFYTTKPFGEGTGLGLPTVYGIVKQHGGNIDVQSEPGNGTTFRIYFPRSGALEREAGPELPRRELGGTETVLVAEDQLELRKLVCRTLAGQGYSILDAPDGVAALRLAESHEGPIHMIVTDVIMEGISGGELFERISEKRKGIKVVFMSGYAGNVITKYGIADHEMDLLLKPFSSQTLVSKVREVLDRK